MCHGPEFITPPLIDPSVIDTTQNAIMVVTKGGTPEWVTYLASFLGMIVSAGIGYFFAKKTAIETINHTSKLEGQRVNEIYLNKFKLTLDRLDDYQAFTTFNPMDCDEARIYIRELLDYKIANNATIPDNSYNHKYTKAEIDARLEEVKTFLRLIKNTLKSLEASRKMTVEAEKSMDINPQNPIVPPTEMIEKIITMREMHKTFYSDSTKKLEDYTIKVNQKIEILKLMLNVNQ